MKNQLRYWLTSIAALIYFFDASFCIIFAQNDSVIDQSKEIYFNGIDALRRKDTLQAEKFFKESIRENSDAASHFELAKIYWSRNSFLSRNLAFENARMSVWQDEKNIEFKYFFAEVCKSFARYESLNQYKEIIALDSSQVNAWINIAESKADDFLEWDKSFRQTDIGLMPLQKFINDDFKDAIKNFEHALKIDSSNYDACLKLSLFYEKTDLPELGIPYLQRLEKLNKADKNIFLALGLLYYKTRKMKQSYDEYSKALSLMSKTEREDFTLNSVKFILKDAYSKMNEMNDDELEEFISRYWKVNDPLHMNDYNERLLEHYSRVAFANLHFSIPKMNVAGWKSNRGEIILRYGEPLNHYRIRPELSSVGERMVIIPKKESWNFENFTINFSDPWMNGNYQFDDSELIFIEDLRKNNPAAYNPKFEGPKLDLPFEILQFKDQNLRNHTNIYLSFGIDQASSNLKGEETKKGFDATFILFNNNFDELIKKKFPVESYGENVFYDLKTNRRLKTQVLNFTTPADSGFATFELVRRNDKAVFTERGKLAIKKFSNTRLDISDIVLASKIDEEKIPPNIIKRNKLGILPQPAKHFGKSDQLFIYYELYNLKKGNDGLTDFDQNIILNEVQEEKSDLEKIVQSVGKLLGLSKEKKIMLTSNYKTLESNPQIYIQLDMSKYKSGRYLITVEVKDKKNGAVTSSNQIVEWENDKE